MIRICSRYFLIIEPLVKQAGKMETAMSRELYDFLAIRQGFSDSALPPDYA
jgi:hypothetical protein